MLRVLCLGQLSVQRDGQLLAGAAAQRRRLAILALLAHAGDRGLSRDKLIGLLWTDTADERARRVTSQALYMLRRDLGSDTAIEGLGHLRFNPAEVSTDVGDFQLARASGSPERAAAAYGGPFLDGFALPGAPDFERWMDEARGALAHQYADALEQAATAAAVRGDHAAAVAWWRKLAAQDKHSARVALALMRALATAGDTMGAIRHAGIYAALVKAELDLPPDPAVAAFAQSLRSAPAKAPPPPAPAAALPAVPVPAPGPSTPRPARRRRWRRVWPRLLISGAAGALAGVGLWQLRPHRGLALDPGRVVVVPLENRTGDPLLDPVGQMAAEWITHGLARTGLVRVVDAQTMLETVRTVAGAAVAPPLGAVAEQTGAGLVVSGAYYRDGDSLRFQVQIAEGRSGDLRRAVDVVRTSAARPRDALEPLRQRITGGLAVLLDNRLNNWTAETSQPPTYEAYQEFLIGMEAFGPDFEEALRHFTRAATLDTSYWQALLWAGMSNADLRRYPPADSLFTILNRNRAQLAPYDQANLDYFDGGFVHGDWERSYQGARRMVELAPVAGHARFALGLTAVITNRPAEAITVLSRIDVDRGWGKQWAPRIYNLLARAHHEQGRHDVELRWAVRMRQADPNVGWARLQEVRALAALHRFPAALARAEEAATFPPTTHTWEPFTPGDFLYEAGRELWAHGAPDLAQGVFERAAVWYSTRPAEERNTRGLRLGLAAARLAQQRWDEARTIYAALLAADTADVVAVGGLGVIAARTGRRAEAEQAIARLERERRPYLFGVPRYWAARIAAVAGDRERAVALLHQARREGTSRIYNFHVEQDFDSLRDYPPYRELLQPRATTAP